MSRQLFFNLTMASRNLHRLAAASLPDGLGLTQCGVLLALSKDRELPISEIARTIGASRPATTELIDRMERMGLTERLPDPSDGRGCLLRLTKVGVEMRQRAKIGVAEFETRLSDGLSEEQLDIIAAWLRSMQQS
jgi:DNA-binding MarR family transcriptional regulator